jgi:hypothetical protein
LPTAPFKNRRLRIVFLGEGGVAVQGYAAHILKTIKRKPKITLMPTIHAIIFNIISISPVSDYQGLPGATLA